MTAVQASGSHTDWPILAGTRLSVTDKLYVHVHPTPRAGNKATHLLNVGPDLGVRLQARRVLTCCLRDWAANG
jgi:hypothetical protein